MAMTVFIREDMLPGPSHCRWTLPPGPHSPTALPLQNSLYSNATETIDHKLL